MPLYIHIPLILSAFSFGVLVMGTALAPALAWFFWVLEQTQGWATWGRAWTVGVGFVIAFACYGFSMMALTVIITRLFPRTKPGEYPFASVQGLQWFFTGMLNFIVSRTFIDFVQMTGINVVYFRLLGAKIGRNVTINTKNISDFHLIEIGDNTMIGGNAFIIGHVGERGKLKMRPVKIGSKVTVGLSAMIFPGVEIGDRAVIGAGALVLKDEKVAPGAVFVGVPGKNLRDREHKGGPS